MGIRELTGFYFLPNEAKNYVEKVWKKGWRFGGGEKTLSSKGFFSSSKSPTIYQVPNYLPIEKSMNVYPEKLQELMELLKRLPGVGRRGSERLALAMLRWSPEKLEFAGELIRTLPHSIGRCPQCGNLAEAGALCAICRMPNRDAGLLCVVEEFSQIAALEQSGGFRGHYHVLGGRLAPLEGKNPADLKIAELLERLEKGTIRELILALSSDVEGRATTVYLSGICAGKVPVISQLAQGLPAGSDPAYADAATLGVALQSRRPL